MPYRDHKKALAKTRKCFFVYGCKYNLKKTVFKELGLTDILARKDLSKMFIG